MRDQALVNTESRPHRKLLAWQEAIRLTSLVYETTRTFPSLISKTRTDCKPQADH